MTSALPKSEVPMPGRWMRLSRLALRDTNCALQDWAGLVSSDPIRWRQNADHGQKSEPAKGTSKRVDYLRYRRGLGPVDIRVRRRRNEVGAAKSRFSRTGTQRTWTYVSTGSAENRALQPRITRMSTGPKCPSRKFIMLTFA